MYLILLLLISQAYTSVNAVPVLEGNPMEIKFDLVRSNGRKFHFVAEGVVELTALTSTTPKESDTTEPPSAESGATEIKPSSSVTPEPGSTYAPPMMDDGVSGATEIKPSSSVNPETGTTVMPPATEEPGATEIKPSSSVTPEPGPTYTPPMMDDWF